MPTLLAISRSQRLLQNASHMRSSRSEYPNRLGRYRSPGGGMRRRLAHRPMETWLMPSRAAASLKLVDAAQASSRRRSSAAEILPPSMPASLQRLDNPLRARHVANVLLGIPRNLAASMSDCVNCATSRRRFCSDSDTNLFRREGSPARTRHPWNVFGDISSLSAASASVRDVS